MSSVHTVSHVSNFENNNSDSNNDFHESPNDSLRQDYEPIRLEPTITQERMERLFSEYFPRYNNTYLRSRNYITEFFEQIQIYTLQDLTDSVFSVSQVLIRYVKAHTLLGISDEVIDMLWDCIDLQNDLMWKIQDKYGWNVINDLISDFDYFVDRSYSTFLVLELDLEIPLDLSLFGIGIFAPREQL